MGSIVGGQGEGSGGGAIIGAGSSREGIEPNSSSNSSVDTEPLDSVEPDITWSSGESPWTKSNSDSLSESRDMLAIRSGIPLALQNKAIRSGVPIGPFQNKRKRKSKSVDSNKSKKRGSISRGRGDLEVRKDLMIESQEYKDLTHHQGADNEESEDNMGQDIHGLLIQEDDSSPHHPTVD